MLPIRHDGICLRRLTARDLDPFLAYRTDPEVARYQSWEQMDRDRAHQFLVAVGEMGLLQPDQWTQIGVALAKSDSLIGDIGIFIAADAAEAELGITLARSAWGQGLATLAFQAAIQLVFAQTPVRQIRAWADTRNAPSVRLLQRVGMRWSHQETTPQPGAKAPLIEEAFVLDRPTQQRE